MKLSLYNLTKLFCLVCFTLLVIFSIQTLAQTQPISESELEKQFQSQLFGNSNVEMVKETRFGNLDKLNEPSTLSAQDNQAPTFVIAPEIKTLRVGEQKLFNFSFSDAENDPYFGGVVALNTRVQLDPGQKTRKELAKEAAIKIDVLPSKDSSIIVWNITAQNPGVAIFFVSIAEIFASNDSGMFKLSSGRIKYVAYAFRVVGENDDIAPPTFLNKAKDMSLRLKERVELTFAANSPEGRPLTYSFLYLAYASRLVNGQFFGNNAQLKAIDPGQGVFIAFAVDGQKADLQTFLVNVIDPKASPETKLKVRALSTSATVLINKPQQLDIYGDNFSPASQIILKTNTDQQLLPVEFISSTNLRTILPTNLKDTATLQVIDAAQTASINFQALAPVVIDTKRISNTSKTIYRLRFLGRELGRGVKVFAGDKELKILEERTFRSPIVDQITVVLPLELRNQSSVELKFIGATGLESPMLVVPLKN